MECVFLKPGNLDSLPHFLFHTDFRLLQQLLEIWLCKD